MGLFSDFVGFVGDVISGVGSFLSEGLSMAVGALTGIAETIGNGIKSLCESVGSEALALIGCIAMSILIPGFGLPEIFAIIECIAQVAKILGVGGEDSPEELGMKTEIADKKPEDFDTIQEYIKYLNEEVKLDKDAVDNLSEVDKAKYGAMGAALNIKAIEEKYDVSLSPDFLRDVTLMKLSSEEVAKCIDKCKESGIDKVQDMTDYLRDKPISSDKDTVSDAMIDTLSEIYPELNKEELEVKLCEMRESLKQE
ncbi:MAG: hypothetical protein MSH21_00980 [Clostridium sp.]|nr:hypothetical protein [Clostridium sp.]